MTRRGIVPGAALLMALALASGGARAAEEDAREAPLGGEQWGANYFPNIPLVTHEGKTVRFFDDLIAGKVVVINFMYTTCADVCPLETAKLSELQAILGDRVGRDVFMYSITIDPKTDTPSVLKEYAERFQVGPGWTFLTGKSDDIRLLRRRLGLFGGEDEAAEGLSKEERKKAARDHNISLLIGNQSTGRWMKRSPFENPYFLANQVGSWLHNWKTAAPNQDSYANAPRVRKTSAGETLFRTRCSSCHVVGDADQVPSHLRMRLLGPDLLGVTKRRDRQWLSRWLAEPDKMLEEKDPLALEMFEKHGSVAMPNMALNPQDVAALLNYLETETYRVESRMRLMGRAPVPAAETAEAAACCMKDVKELVSEQTVPGAAPAAGALSAASRAGGENLGGRPLNSRFAYVSIGLGCLFLLAAYWIRRRGA